MNAAVRREAAPVILYAVLFGFALVLLGAAVALLATAYQVRRDRDWSGGFVAAAVVALVLGCAAAREGVRTYDAVHGLAVKGRWGG